MSFRFNWEGPEVVKVFEAYRRGKSGEGPKLTQIHLSEMISKATGVKKSQNQISKEYNKWLERRRVEVFEENEYQEETPPYRTSLETRQSKQSLDRPRIKYGAKPRSSEMPMPWDSLKSRLDNNPKVQDLISKYRSMGYKGSTIDLWRAVSETMGIKLTHGCLNRYLLETSPRKVKRPAPKERIVRKWNRFTHPKGIFAVPEDEIQTVEDLEESPNKTAEESPDKSDPQESHSTFLSTNEHAEQQPIGVGVTEGTEFAQECPQVSGASLLQVVKPSYRAKRCVPKPQQKPVKIARLRVVTKQHEAVQVEAEEPSPIAKQDSADSDHIEVDSSPPPSPPPPKARILYPFRPPTPLSPIPKITMGLKTIQSKDRLVHAQEAKDINYRFMINKHRSTDNADIYVCMGCHGARAKERRRRREEGLEGAVGEAKQMTFRGEDLIEIRGEHHGDCKPLSNYEMAVKKVKRNEREFLLSVKSVAEEFEVPEKELRKLLVTFPLRRWPFLPHHKEQVRKKYPRKKNAKKEHTMSTDPRDVSLYSSDGHQSTYMFH